MQIVLALLRNDAIASISMMFTATLTHELQYLLDGWQMMDGAAFVTWMWLEGIWDRGPAGMPE